MSGARLLLAAALLAGCGREPRGGRPVRHVVLIVLDTLRADRLHCYGHPRPTSPHLDRLAAGATRYTRAWSTAPWTVPAHASLFTGLYPFAHGAHTRAVDASLPDAFNVVPLAEAHTTLAETFRDRGYRTAAFVANEAFLSVPFQLHQGFERYFCERLPAAAINARVGEWLEQHAGESFFLFLNYMDVHLPYQLDPSPAIRARLRDGPLPELSAAQHERLYAEVLDPAVPLPEDLLAALAAQHEVAVAQLDEQVGALLERLRALDLEADTLLVVTSDHGEYFGEHRLIHHSKDVYEPALWIPLLVRQPGQEQGAVEERPISLAHLPRLILGWAGLLDALASGWQQARAWPEDVLLAQNWYSRMRDLRGPAAARFQRARSALRAGDWKYISSSDGQHELYDLRRDPGELDNRIESERQVESRLREQLRELLAQGLEAPPGAAARLSPEELAVLRELGYH